MDTMNKLMTGIFEELVESELKEFTRQLWMGVKSGVDPIPRGKLENKDRQDVVDSMVQFYGKDAGRITVQALRNMKQKERANRLESNLLTVQALVQEDERKPKDPQPITSILQPTLQPIQQPINTARSEDLEPIQADWQRPLSIIPSSQEFKDRVLDQYRDNIYTPVSRTQRKGLALLITNIEFANKQLNRAGAERDEENMEWLLRALGFMVIKYTNLTGKEISRAVQDFSRRHEHKDADCTFVVIMSHGKRIDEKDAIIGINYDEIHNSNDVYFVKETFSHLNTENCRALFDKLKVILIQACRASETEAHEGGVYVEDAAQAKDSWVHREKDFACFMSTLPDTFAYRDTINGSYFISYIVDVFSSSACKDDIMELFRKVTLRMEKDPRFLGRAKLLPCIERTSIAKKFYLFPGL